MTHLHSHINSHTSMHIPYLTGSNSTQGKSAHELHGQACETQTYHSPLFIPRDQLLGVPCESHRLPQFPFTLHTILTGGPGSPGWPASPFGPVGP